MTGDSPLVLVVEDDEIIRHITCQALSANAYRVIEAATGKQALEEVARQDLDVILLDLGLPDMSGIDVIRQLSTSRLPPVVVFSAGGLQRNKIEALEAGAVDYIDKPFLVGDLLLRLRSALRQSGKPDGQSGKPEVDAGSHFKFGNLNVDLQSHRVTVYDHEVPLTSREFRLLTVFVRNAGRLLTYRSLNHEIEDPNETPDSTALSTIVAQLRHKLEPDPLHPRYLLAEMGIGYRFRDE